MNQKQKLKQHREEWREIGHYFMDNNLNKANDYEAEQEKLFSCNILTYSRTRCKMCDQLINLGDYNVFPRYNFFGYYSKSNNIHLKCFVKAVREDLSSIENYVTSMEFNLKGKDFDMNEVDQN